MSAATPAPPAPPRPELPVCRWRGPRNGVGRFPCASPKLVSTPAGVPPGLCLQCPFADHPETSGEPLILTAPPTDLGVGTVRPTRPRVVATLAVGECGAALLELSRPLFERHAAACGADYHEVAVADSAYPLGEKFRLGTLLDHWERVCFFDADVLVGRAAPDLFARVPETHVGVHDDLADVARVAGTEWLVRQYADLADSQGDAAPGPLACLNTGVVVYGRAHRALWTPPARPYPAYHCGEQNAVNRNLARAGLPVYRLADGLNYQWWAHPGMPGPAAIWHFAKPPNVGEGARLALMRERRGFPGARLKALLASFGATAGPGCKCNQRAAQMDEWGAAGCRERRPEIVAWLEEEWRRLGWLHRVKIGVRALGTVPLSDPVGGLVDEAIRLSEAELIP